MIRKTFSKEIKELLRDGRVRLAIVIVLGLLAVSLWRSAKQYQNLNKQYATAKASERNNWEGQGEKNPHSAAHFGTYAFKPKYPLSLLDQGIDKYVGNSIFLEAHSRNEAQFIDAADQTGLARFGDLTPDFVLLFIMPLLIILLGYNSFTKEREMGTLRLLKSQGIKPSKWLFGKWLALYIPILGISVVLFGTAGIILSNLKDFGVFSWSSLGALFLVYALYYAIFSNLVLLLSSLVKKSGVALVLCISVWILSCLATPKIASNVADNTYPYPTRQELASNIQKDKDNGLDGHNPWSKEAKALEEEVLKEYGVDSIQQLPFNYSGYLMQKGEEHEAEILAKHYNKLTQLNQKQFGVYKNLAILSPYLPARFLSMSIAQTDYNTYQNFTNAAEQYRIATQGFLNGDLQNNASYGDWGYTADSNLWKKLPKFEYTPPRLVEIISYNKSNIFIMGLWFVIPFMLLLFAIKKI